MHHRASFSIAVLCLAALYNGSGAAATGEEVLGMPSLRVVNPFVVLGSNATLTIESEPGASFTLLVSRAPAEVSAGAAGTLFLAPGTSSTAASGVIGLDGTAIVSIPIQSPQASAGTILYYQARVGIPPDARFSNAVPIRAEAAPSTGPRMTRSIATTPDGAKAYVAHEADGSVSVIDAVTDTKLAELPLGPSARGIPHRPVNVAVDPEGRHAFVANAASSRLSVIHVATDSVAAQLSVPTGCRAITFDFSGGAPRVYVANEVRNAVLVFEESSPGSFSQLPMIPLQGSAPGPMAALPGGLLMVGHRATLDLEVVDPAAPSGSTTVARTPLGRLPFDLVLTSSDVLVPTHIPSTGGTGLNVVQRVSLSTFQVTANLLTGQGTDYVDAAVAGPLAAVVGAGSGAAIVAEAATGALIARVDLVPGGPVGTPHGVAFVTPAGGAASKLYVVDRFRETARPVLIGSGPPFALGGEIALGHGGQPRVPLAGDLTPEEDGEWFFRSVAFFNGTATSPNPVTCATCHADGASDNVTRIRQVPPSFGMDDTRPYGWNGGGTDLLTIIQNTFNTHGVIGGPLPPGADQLMLAFFNAFEPPRSIYLRPDGSLTPTAQAGRTLFEGPAQCSSCHTGPVFIPQPPNPLTITEGIGTGLAPANVPSLRGVWATAPYLHDGSALTLTDVFSNPADTHGQVTSSLTPSEIQQLIAYVRSL